MVPPPLLQKVLDLECEPTCMAHPPTYLNKVLVGCADGTVHLWNINTLVRLYIFRGWGAAVCCIEPSPEADVVAFGLADGAVVIADVKHDEVLMRFRNATGLTGAEGGRAAPAAPGTHAACKCLAFRCARRCPARIALRLAVRLAASSDAAGLLCRTGSGPPLLAVAGAPGVITVWNLDERKLQTVIQGAHNGGVAHLHFFAQEPVLMSSGADNAVKQWIFDNSDGSARELRGRSGHAAPPQRLSFYGADGTVLLSAAEDRALRAFSIIQDQQSRELSQVCTDDVEVSAAC